MSYPGRSLGKESYPSAEMQLVYYTAPANWTLKQIWTWSSLHCMPKGNNFSLNVMSQVRILEQTARKTLRHKKVIRDRSWNFQLCLWLYTAGHIRNHFLGRCQSGRKIDFVHCLPSFQNQLELETVVRQDNFLQGCVKSFGMFWYVLVCHMCIVWPKQFKPLTVVDSIVVVSALTYTLLHLMCDLKAAQMIAQHSLICEFML